MKARVGIIVNSYNNDEGLLVESLWSCLKQTGVDIKLVLSTVKGDSSIKVAKRLSSDIEVVLSNKPGIYSQLNNALPAVYDCDWFTYFSGNDLCLPTKAIDEVTICKENKAQICYSAFYSCDKDLKHRKLSLLRPYNYQQHITVGNFVSDVAMVSTDILKKYAPFKEIYGNYAYYDFWLRIAEGEGSRFFIHNSKPEWLYRVSKDSKHVKRKKDPEKINNYKKIRNQMLNDHKGAV